SLAPQPAANRVDIAFTLQNQSEEPVQVLKWRTPLEGVKGAIFDVRCDGRELRDQGPSIKRGSPTSADYVTLAGRSNVTATVNLSETYQFPATGSCQVRFSGTVLEVRGSGAAASTEVLRNVSVEGEPVTFQLS